MAGERRVYVSIDPISTNLYEAAREAIVKVRVGDDDNRVVWVERVDRDKADAVPDRVLALLNAAFDSLSPTDETEQTR